MSHCSFKNLSLSSWDFNHDFVLHSVFYFWIFISSLNIIKIANRFEEYFYITTSFVCSIEIFWCILSPDIFAFFKKFHWAPNKKEEWNVQTSILANYLVGKRKWFSSAIILLISLILFNFYRFLNIINILLAQ